MGIRESIDEYPMMIDIIEILTHLYKSILLRALPYTLVRFSLCLKRMTWRLEPPSLYAVVHGIGEKIALVRGAKPPLLVCVCGRSNDSQLLRYLEFLTKSGRERGWGWVGLMPEKEGGGVCQRGPILLPFKKIALSFDLGMLSSPSRIAIIMLRLHALFRRRLRESRSTHTLTLAQV